jgi:hypothetical protein
MKWCSEMAPGLPEAVSAVTIVRVLCAAAWKRTLDRIEVTCFWSGFFASPIAQRIRLGPCTCLARLVWGMHCGFGFAGSRRGPSHFLGNMDLGGPISEQHPESNKKAISATNFGF